MGKIALIIAAVVTVAFGAQVGRFPKVRVPLPSTTGEPRRPAAIPMVVYATAPDAADPEHIESLRENVATAAGIDAGHLHVYNDSAMAESVCRISKELEVLGADGVYEAFVQLRPGAFKADLWRYMALWDHGGVYMDMDLRLNTAMDEWLDFSDPRLVLVKDIPPRSFWNALMASPPRHPGLLAIIQSIVVHVRRKFYGSNALNLTGPTAFFEALQEVPDIDSKVRVSLEKRDVGNDCGGYPWPPCDARVVKIDDPDALIAYKDLSSASSLHGPSHYSTLYDRHQCYCSDPGPPCPMLPACK